ncbi:RNA-binding S4 domain protein [Gluconacetobacter diazotrophicus PA1 5]|uniref:Putative RNA-binding S4 n=1 Tax=Gluconacetobacter diazotrophicus (strain ATCC 49037 / DSM 5601 / CCUG 37298 / CIP 103539 / LMG 7603 / PAl5) TaxID=272568 RepID=A9HJY8_GLUDA|nr:S4 domain-containing protein [Gluconacetobacter diazotrophicus]ACI50051.1 RNA-binding S4 domain protein [Gluconacetobacter diazotrophicus PA1 5]TWB07869.1 ribosome-associated heat shock protein Hsp15 [Gluconacetobacter diazotrophicus]CAP55973.1 putative RNA-binding S4 [Gluconacetobacter diazotrophicus PA1 5]
MKEDRHPAASGADDAAIAAQRLDLWLWCARFARHRPDCARMAQDGLVRINRQRTEKAHALVRRGDVLTLPGAGDHGVMVVRVLGLVPRRGSATLARLLYDIVPEQAEAG